MKYKIGDKYYSVFYNDVMRVIALPGDDPNSIFNKYYYKIQWERYDSDRITDVNVEDGFVHEVELEANMLCTLPLIKFETMQELLKLRIQFESR